MVFLQTLASLVSYPKMLDMCSSQKRMTVISVPQRITRQESLYYESLRLTACGVSQIPQLHSFESDVFMFAVTIWETVTQHWGQYRAYFSEGRGLVSLDSRCVLLQIREEPDSFVWVQAGDEAWGT